MKTLLLLISIVALAGCSSPTLQPPKYYVLSGMPNFSASEVVHQIPIEVRSVVLSDYLQSSNIVLQISDHELFFSANHLWAEPLQIGIEKLLANHLSSSSDLQMTPLKLDVQVDYFHIVDLDAVILSGRYGVDGEDGESLITERFSLRQPLKNSGYEYAVSVMSSILKELSIQIEESVKAKVR